LPRDQAAARAASKLIGLAYIAATQERHEDTLVLLDEAARSPRLTMRSASCARSTKRSELSGRNS